MSIYSIIVLYFYRTLKLTTEEPATGQAVRLLILFILILFNINFELLKVKKRATSIDDQITMALDVLGWLCDGQQIIMQDALTTQSTFSVIYNNVYIYTVFVYITITGF